MTPCLILTSQLSHDLLTMENNKNQRLSAVEWVLPSCNFGTV